MFGQSTFFLAFIYFLHLTLAVPNPANGVSSRDSTATTDALVQRGIDQNDCTDPDKVPTSEPEDVGKVLDGLKNDGTCVVSAQVPVVESLGLQLQCMTVSTVGTASVYICLGQNYRATYTCWEVANIGLAIRGECPRGGDRTDTGEALYVNIINPSRLG